MIQNWQSSGEGGLHLVWTFSIYINYFTTESIIYSYIYFNKYITYYNEYIALSVIHFI